jgi:hypothetical protein
MRETVATTPFRGLFKQSARRELPEKNGPFQVRGGPWDDNLHLEGMSGGVHDWNKELIELA